MIPKAEESKRLADAICKAMYSSEKFLESVENTIAHSVNVGSCEAYLSRVMFMQFSTEVLEQSEKELQSLGYTVYRYTIGLNDAKTWLDTDSICVSWSKP